MRLIDADALIEELRDKLGEALGLESQDASGLRLAIDIVEDTIDAEPVRHGTWIEERGDLHSSGRVVTCPLCHKQHFIPSRTMSWWVSDESVFQKPDRCRSCGAKMDGGVSDD